MSLTDNSSYSRPTWLLVAPWSLDSAGGVNQVVLNLYDQLKQKGNYRPLVMVVNWTAAAPQSKVEVGRDALHLRLRQPPTGPLEALAWLWRAPKEIAHLLKLLARENVVVANIHYPGLSAFSFALLKALRLYKGHLLLSFHGQDVTDASRLTGLSRYYYRVITSRADAISTCSAALAEAVQATFPANARKTVVIHNGISPDESDKDGDLLPEIRALDGKYFVNVATYEPKKGQDLLLRAFATIAADYPDYRLVMAGRDAGCKGNLQKLAESLGIASQVLLYGPLPHDVVLALYREARALIMPSRSEPFGIVILEAGLRNTPVVATRVGGIPEILVSNEFGTLVDPEDPAALTKAMHEVLENPDEFKRKARNLKERILTHFSWEASSARLESLAGK